MPLLGQAAMLLSFDIDEDTVSEHDDWHTHEHLPERLSILGFLRGSRWVAVQGHPMYFVIYEVEHLGILASEPYLARLNNPSPWTTKLMPYYRGMNRGFCAVLGSFGFGLGHMGMLVRFKLRGGTEPAFRTWLLQVVLPHLSTQQGIGSTHLFEAAVTPPMTNEQRIRGVDAGFDWALFVTGYSHMALDSVSQSDLGLNVMEQHGALSVVYSTYRFDYSLSRHELDA